MHKADFADKRCQRRSKTDVFGRFENGQALCVKKAGGEPPAFDFSVGVDAVFHAITVACDENRLAVVY